MDLALSSMFPNLKSVESNENGPGSLLQALLPSQLPISLSRPLQVEALLSAANIYKTFLLNLTSNKSSCLQQNIFWNFYSICRKGVILRKACILFQITWCHVDFCMVIIHIFTCTAPYRQLHQRLSHCWLSSGDWREGLNLASSKSRWPSLRCSIWAAAFLTPLHYQYMIIQIHFPHNLYHLTWVYCRLFHCDTAPEPPPSPSDKKSDDIARSDWTQCSGSVENKTRKPRSWATLKLCRPTQPLLDQCSVV